MNSVVEPDEVDAPFRALFESCRDTCLWFWASREVPSALADRLEALRQIELHGTRDQFIRARSLRQWL